MNTDKKDSLSDSLRRKTSAPSAAPATNSEAPEVIQVLDGDLSEKPISWLLMAAQHYEVTGRLQVGLAACSVIVQFGLGRAVHAQSPFSTGKEAILDLFIWKDGKVRFEPGRQPDSVTIQESTEDLIAKGERYKNSLSFLEHYAINEMSFLVRSPERMSSADVETRLAKGQQIDPTMQMEFYSNIYGTRNLKDTAEKLALPPSQWISIAANLLQLGILCTPEGRNIGLKELVEPRSQSSRADYESLRLPQVEAEGEAAAKPFTASLWQSKFVAARSASELPTLSLGSEVAAIAKALAASASSGTDTATGANPVQDTSANPITVTTMPTSQSDQMPLPANAALASPASIIRLGIPDQMLTLSSGDYGSALSLLNEASSGILRFDVLQFFLVREFARAYRFKTMLSLVLFCVKFAGSENQSVPLEVRSMLTGAVSRFKRDVDIFGHFGSQAFALLLPNVDSYQSCFLIDRINSELLQLNPELAKYRPTLHFGVASVPQDAVEINGLVKAAQIAMIQAAATDLLRVQPNA